MDEVVATVLGGVRERGREGLKMMAGVVNIVVVMKHKSLVVRWWLQNRGNDR